MEPRPGSDPDLEAAAGPDPAPAAAPPPDLEPLLEDCRRSLERGDYGQVLRRLEPLVASAPPTTLIGGELQLLMATAWMGQGNSARAIACCHQLKRCRDARLRAQAKDLLAILEAPALERPREWSITLPELSAMEGVQGRMTQIASRRRSRTPDTPPPPPVGPTRANVGFALLVAVLMLVAVLLGGCMQVRTDLHLAGPGRVQVGYVLRADGSRATPWQRQFGEQLAGAGFRLQGSRGGTTSADPLQLWRSPTLPAASALGRLSTDLGHAARLAGLELAPPRLELRERNLLLGVRQTLTMELDLTPLAGAAGLDLAVRVDPVSARAVRQASPLPALAVTGKRAVDWPLQPGALNRLELHCWRWSPLGLGAVLVGLLLGLALALQTLRRAIAPPLPELPA